MMETFYLLSEMILKYLSKIYNPCFSFGSFFFFFFFHLIIFLVLQVEFDVHAPIRWFTQDKNEW